MQRPPEIKLKSFLFFTAILVAGNILIWSEGASAGKTQAGFYFLNVGQGDSELAVFPFGAKVITDAGPGKQVASEAQSVLGTLDNYIDLAIISHPELDHYGGFAELLTRYDIGMLITNGREPAVPSREWSELMKEVRAKNIPMLAVGAGDNIFLGKDEINVLSPTAKLQRSKEMNDTCIVERVSLGGVKELLTGDIGDKTEKALLSSGADLRADILKVAHHGSKYSSSAAFLAAVSPSVAMIEVGKKNTYGHPTQAVLDRLAAVGASIFRTDQLGTIGAREENGTLAIGASAQ